MKVSNQTYDLLKFIALLIVPIAAFIGSVANAIGYDATIIVTILTALDTLLGAVIKILSDGYTK
jgi:UPF0716 family protein affecting phage T7 exclusion